MTTKYSSNFNFINSLLLALIISFTLGCAEENLEPDASLSFNEVRSAAAGDAIPISNAGFESSWSGWSDTDPSSISGDTNAGSGSAKITGAGGGFTQNVAITANTEYSLSAYVKGSWRIGVNVGGTRATRSGNTSDWKKETVTFNSGSSTTATILGEYNSGEGRFDDFQLIQGSSSNPGTGNTGNLALSGTASQSSTGYSGSASRAIDGNTNGSYSSGSVTHTATSDASPWWQVDLGSTENIGDIKIFNRTDGCCVSRLSNFTVSVINANGTTTFSKTYNTAPNPSLTVDAGGASGKIVRVALNVNNRLSLAEVEVYAGSGSPTSYVAIPAKIEAEDYDDATEGRTQPVSDGNDNTLNVGWINTDEFLSYNVNVPSSGAYTMDFRVASSTSNTKFDIYQGNNKIGSVNSSPTGNYQSWKTISTSVQLNSGNQVIKLVATGNNWNINWLEFKSGSTNPPTGTLDPSKAPSENFDLSQWKITLSSGSDKSVAELNNGLIVSNQFYTDSNDGGMVFKNYPKGAGTTTSSTYSRVELRELIGGENSNASAQGINENNWVFSTSSNTNKGNAGGVDGKLTATLKVDRVTNTSTSTTQVGRIVIGQIHASGNEPCRLYYKLMPGTTKGAIYFIHEDSNGNEIAVNMIGSYAKTGSGVAGDYTGASEPSNGIPLGEVFSYRIEVIGNSLYVDIYRDGSPDVSEMYDMSSSGYANDWMYFKAGLYSQNKNVQSNTDFEQVTFYELSQTHD
jgi:hypothetical protein